ncbi:MAG: hypothetical protein ACKPB7_27725, partial [Sphaerospermopsis kisseleviana]
VSGITILNRLLSLLGLKLQQANNVDKGVDKVYKIDMATLNDGRDKIFAVWQQCDELRLYHLHGVNTEIIDYSLSSQFMVQEVM